MFADAPNDPAKDAAAEQKKQERMQKLQQLTFDRRPSAILKAWATPREVALEDTAKVGDNAQASPAIANRVVRRVGPDGVIVQSPESTQGKAGEPAKPDPFDRELRGFQRDVTLSDWPAVKGFVAKLDKEEGKAAYDHLLQALASGQAGGQGMMPGQMQMQMMMNGGMAMPMQPQQYMMERNAFTNQDVLGLSWSAPAALEKQQLDHLGQILRQSLDLGNAVEDFVARARAELKKPAKEAARDGTPDGQAAVRSGLRGRSRSVSSQPREGREG